MPASVSADPAVERPAPSADDGLRARKKRRRHGELVDAAQRLVLDRGLDAVTVEEICETVGVSPRTFFNYFPSKDDAVLGLEPFQVGPDVAADFVAGGPTGVLLDDLARVVADVLQHQQASPDRMHRTMQLVTRETRLLARHVAWVEEHRAEMVGLFTARHAVRPSPADPELLALVVMSLLRVSLLEWERHDGEGGPADHLDAVVAQLRALLEPPPTT
ncbi:TetR/AcrR family transcriptional regulator [Cellulosimicrobium marinum]|uniref:TetR/AcrR family transcriptional regulator n=1 Tax=Cellulosimicrobium marinum TaxID=1638992 RepID=UPI001E383D11|nr:TetR/AcrR family transcriptional regulator [Cellulosimicrobium marinum]MCB7137665.1 TetR/AcrR family transcriptional regulator [Cellulosimicrobium marinum]